MFFNVASLSQAFSYLLSPQTSLVGGLGSPTARMTLVGTKNPGKAAKDKDSIILSEVFEFALSLVPTVKGQEAFYGLAQLQTYRFIRAMEIAEHGDLQLANRFVYIWLLNLLHDADTLQDIAMPSLHA